MFYFYFQGSTSLLPPQQTGPSAGPLLWRPFWPEARLSPVPGEHCSSGWPAPDHAPPGLGQGPGGTGLPFLVGQWYLIPCSCPCLRHAKVHYLWQMPSSSWKQDHLFSPCRRAGWDSCWIGSLQPSSRQYRRLPYPHQTSCKQRRMLL